MFDIGFTELLLIAVLALVVLGPKRLPETVRFIGLWLGRLRRSLSAARRDLEREIGMDDIRRQLHNEEILQELERTQRQLDAGNDTRADTPVKAATDAEDASTDNRPAPGGNDARPGEQDKP